MALFRVVECVCENSVYSTVQYHTFVAMMKDRADFREPAGTTTSSSIEGGILAPPSLWLGTAERRSKFQGVNIVDNGYPSSLASVLPNQKPFCSAIHFQTRRATKTYFSMPRNVILTCLELYAPASCQEKQRHAKNKNTVDKVDR